jgi:hypothetical protein
MKRLILTFLFAVQALVAQQVVINAVSPSIGGFPLSAGACFTQAVSVPGVMLYPPGATPMTVTVSPQAFPINGVAWQGYVSATDVVTLKICHMISGNVPASVYNINVLTGVTTGPVGPTGPTGPQGPTGATGSGLINATFVVPASTSSGTIDWHTVKGFAASLTSLVSDPNVSALIPSACAISSIRLQSDTYPGGTLNAAAVTLNLFSAPLAPGTALPIGNFSLIDADATASVTGTSALNTTISAFTTGATLPVAANTMLLWQIVTSGGVTTTNQVLFSIQIYGTCVL